jgi:hypothetical protein
MRSFRSLVVLAVIAVALSVVAPSASAASPKSFHVEKVCDSPIHCVITFSSFKAIPAGTEINYTVRTDGNLNAVINVSNGSATGVCGPATLPTFCTFSDGTGRLTQFHLDVAVSPNVDFSVWFWDGTYWFGRGE